MADLTNLKAGDYISVLCESDGEKYECKIEEVVDGTGELRIHRHGFNRKDDFVLASDSSKIFDLNEATVLPPRSAKSKKTHDNDIWHETQEIIDESNESGKCAKCSSSLQVNAHMDFQASGSQRALKSVLTNTLRDATATAELEHASGELSANISTHHYVNRGRIIVQRNLALCGI